MIERNHPNINAQKVRNLTSYKPSTPFTWSGLRAVRGRFDLLILHNVAHCGTAGASFTI